MPFFANTKQLYVCAEQLIYRIQEEDPRASDAMAAARVAIRLNVSEPSGEIVINGRSRPVTAHFPPGHIQPDLDVYLSGDTLHQILLGQLGMQQAIARKLLQVKGPVFKVMTLAPLLQKSQQIYPLILREQGLW